jgi:hypothetical protein
MTKEQINTENNVSVEGEQVKGRSVFVVETTPAGVAVQTALLTDGDKLIPMPAIFPDVQYAFDQIDELKRLVSQHFSQAAKVGAQALNQQVNSDV